MPKLLKTGLTLALIPLCFVLGLYAGPHAARLYREWFPPPQYQTGDFAALYAKAGQSVVMYSTSTCPYCAKVRKLFAEKGVRYTEYQIDTSQPAAAEFEKLDAPGVPVLFIGERRIDGYREKAIVEALAEVRS
jgi:glutaredoxin